MQHKNDEPMIYLKDLIFVVLYRWKAVIAAALILALALGGAKLFPNLSMLRNEESSETLTSDQIVLIEKYEAEKQSLEERIDALQEQIKSQNEYFANSIYMQLNPYNFYESTVVLYFDTDYQILPNMTSQNPDPTDSVIAAYQTILNSDQALLPLSKAVETEPQYIKELISISVDINADTLTVKLYYPDQSGAEKLAAQLLAQLDAIQTHIERTVAAHQVNTVSNTVSKRVDYNIADKQNENTAKMTTFETTLADMQKKMNALVNPAPQQVDKTAVIKSGIIYAVVGFVLGAFLVTFVTWISHISSDKVYSARTLKNRTGAKVLGCISSQEAGSVDRWLRKLEGRNTVDPQTQANILAVDILNRCGNISSLLIGGSANAQERQLLVQALAQAMPGVQITDAGNLTQDTTALETLANCDAVLLVEQCNYSKYNSVAQQLEWIKDYNKQLIGCVLLGG